MTIQEICEAILAETTTKTWAVADSAVRLETIEYCIDQLSAEPEHAAKKIKQRKPRSPNKPKAAPLTQHAEASE